ncbi:50S ribosomal protein L17 [bacterium]|nr:50S ribosomal protein L17 [bacterium]
MRHRVRGRKFGLESDHRKAMLHNLVKSLIEHGRINTTLARAKEMRSLAERCVTYAKKNDIHNRRLAYKILQDRDLVKRLFEEIAPNYTTRNGGYTRVLKAGNRRGDNAPMAIIEFVDEVGKKEVIAKAE